MFDTLGISYREIREQKDLEKLPLLSKEDLLENIDSLKADNIADYHATPNFTGGSTGEPVTVYQSQYARDMVAACVWRHWGWFGFRYGESKAVLRAPQDYSSTYMKSIQGRDKNSIKHPEMFHDKKYNTLYLSPYDMSDEVLDQFIEALIKGKYKVIMGTPSSLYILASYLRDRKVNEIRPSAIQVSSETFYPFQRSLIEEQFDCMTYDWYGSGERVVKAGECSEHSGYHLCSEFGLLEVVNEGKRAAEGETGELIVTTLINYAMPLIRYRIGDMGALTSANCSCGRGLPLLKTLQGKIRDVVVTPDGKKIHGEFFKYVIEKSWIQSGRCIQEKIDSLVIEIVPKNEIPGDELDRIERFLKDYIGERMNIGFKVVDAIEPTAAGKRHYVISKIA
ncbi:phenylacetate--CoA ligase family protein [Thermodesulfobacteriota bacterium]